MDVHDPVHAYVDLLCLLGSVHAAFTGLTCSTPDFCIQRSLSGSVCLHSNYSSSYWTCAPPYKLPLEAHLSQNYSIGHYNANGQYLGGWNFSLPGPTTSPNPIYLCMSARVNMTSAHYVTYCAEVVVDNSWQGTGCFVGIVPPYVVDGCYAGPASASTTGTTTTIPATDSDQPRVQTTVTPSTDGPPTISSPSGSTSIKRSLLKDIGYSVIWAPILIFLTVVF